MAEQRAPSAARALHEIDACLDVLASEGEALLRAICSGRATSVAAIIASLNIARRLLPPADPAVMITALCHVSRIVDVVARAQTRRRSATCADHAKRRRGGHAVNQ